MRTSLIGRQCREPSSSVTQPLGPTPEETPSEVAARSSQKVGYASFKGLLVATVTAMMFCTSARAAQCEGPIAAVAMHDDGRLLVRQGTLNSPIWSICNVNNSQGYAASVATCRSWQAILMAAQKAGSTVQLYTSSTACNLGDWGNADVYYLEDRG